MKTAAYFCIYVPDDDEPIDGTEDYDEAVALCRALVEEDGNPSAEVRCGDRICCAMDWDEAGRVRVRDVGEEGAAPPVASRLRRPTRVHTEQDVTHTLRSSSMGDRPGVPAAIGGHAFRNPDGRQPLPSTGLDGSSVSSVMTGAPVILGDDPARPATLWLGL